MAIDLEFICETRSQRMRQSVCLTKLVIAGWTGRDKAAVQHHIEELAALGVPRPSKTPIYYRVAASRLTHDPVIEVIGETSSGEAEVMVLSANDALWIGLGSDHTDRAAEAHGITLSKQMCDKPIASTLWSHDEVAGHWDSLILRSSIIEDGREVPYQDGPIASLLSPDDLIKGYSEGVGLAEGTAMFGGTHAAIGGVRPSRHFKMALIDPVLGRQITHSYETVVLPVEG